MSNSSQQVLHFAGLLRDCLRQNDVQTVRICTLGATDNSHVGSVGTATGDDLVAGKHQRVGQHFYQLLVSEGQVSGADDCDSLRTTLLN